MSDKVGVPWLVAPFAFVLAISIAGIASAWLSGSARIPFVAGLDSYLPSALGKLHPRFSTPYVALIVQTGISILFLAMSFIGAQVKEAFQTLLNLAVVLQLVPFLYMFAALDQAGFERFRAGRLLQQDHAAHRRNQRIHRDLSRHRAGLLPSPRHHLQSARSKSRCGWEPSCFSHWLDSSSSFMEIVRPPRKSIRPGPDISETL